MDCKNAQEILGPYLDGAMPADREKLLRDHLASCTGCSRALEELKKAQILIKGLDEVEPPPWLTQKIMAHVREEAENKVGLFERLFYPLRIKVPLQVIATVVVVAIAALLFREVTPEMPKTGKIPVKPEQTTPQVTQPGAPAQSVPGVPVKAAPRRAIEQKKGEASSSVAASSTAPAAPVPQAGAGQETYTKDYDRTRADQTRAGTARQADIDSVQRQTKSVPIFEERYAERLQAPAPSAAVDNQADRSRSAVRRAEEAPKQEAPRAVYKSKAVAGKKDEPIGLSVRVPDIEKAAREIEGFLTQLGARNVAREPGVGVESITAELKGEKGKAVVDRLDRMGEVNASVSAFPAGNVAIRIDVLPE